MKAAVIQRAGQLVVESIPEPTPGPREVLLRVGAVGICGTDLHIYAGHHAKSFPVIPGHELSGTVVEVGDEVEDVGVGDHVVVDPGIACGTCYSCRRGRQNRCERPDAIGISRQGGMAEFVTAPAYKCAVLPADVDLSAAALVEPISCVVHAFDMITPGYGLTVGIYGAGPIGLIVTSLIKDIAGSIGVIDLNKDRLEWALKAGASQVATAAKDIAPDRGFDIVIDCTGAAPAIEDGIRNVAVGGTFLQFGVPSDEATVSLRPADLFRKEINLVGSNSGHNSFERAVQLMIRGAVPADIVISDRFPLDEAPAAFEAFKAGRGRKLQFVPAG